MNNIIKKYKDMRDNETEQELITKQKLRRQIEDYLRKYANIKELRVIADFLGIEQKENKQC